MHAQKQIQCSCTDAAVREVGDCAYKRTANHMPFGSSQMEMADTASFTASRKAKRVAAKTREKNCSLQQAGWPGMNG